MNKGLNLEALMKVLQHLTRNPLTAERLSQDFNLRDARDLDNGFKRTLVTTHSPLIRNELIEDIDPTWDYIRFDHYSLCDVASDPAKETFGAVCMESEQDCYDPNDEFPVCLYVGRKVGGDYVIFFHEHCKSDELYNEVTALVNQYMPFNIIQAIGNATNLKDSIGKRFVINGAFQCFILHGEFTLDAEVLTMQHGAEFYSAESMYEYALKYGEFETIEDVRKSVIEFVSEDNQFRANYPDAEHFTPINLPTLQCTITDYISSISRTPISLDHELLQSKDCWFF